MSTATATATATASAASGAKPGVKPKTEAPAPRPLDGKVALVTGGSRGIGRATAIALSRLGADVAINYQRSREAADEAAQQCREHRVRVQALQADVSIEVQACRMVDQVRTDFGRIDILVNNAGITRDKSFLKMTRMIWDEVLGVNLNGPFNVTHAVLPGMVQSGWGRIINVASVVGQTGNFGQANYAVTKGGIIGFTLTLAREVGRKGVTVNAVAPGFIDTDMTRDVPPMVMDTVKNMTPLGRIGTPEEVAAAITFLASPEASYITGHVLAVNGGMYM
jgi:3-oxoacyl-(acyl-carrier-protein) reductase